MFTLELINEKLANVKTGTDFPVLARSLKNIGVTSYETYMQDGRSIYHGKDGYELQGGPNYAPIEVADKIDLDRLKIDIANHQQGKSDYFQISRACAANGIASWSVCLLSMTCTYLDKEGNKVWVEQIPAADNEKTLFTADQIKVAHAKVRSGADFPAYIREIKNLGVTHYETYVADGHIDYHGLDDHTIELPAKYDPLTIAAAANKEKFETTLRAHQQGKSDFLTFIHQCAELGIEKWEICMDKMTCTYYDRSGHQVLVEAIPQ